MRPEQIITGFSGWRYILLAFIFVFSVCAANAQTDPSVVGQWSPVQTWPLKAVHTHLLPTGKVMFWTSYGAGNTNPQLWDPVQGNFTTLANSGFNLFCAGHVLLRDGKLFVAGGHVALQVGLPTAAIYDPNVNSWTRLPDMNAGRWYPTATMLASGDVVVMSGAIDQTVGVNTTPQVWQVATNNWRDLTGAQLQLPLYPRNFLAPNGKIFNAAPSKSTRYLDPSGSGAWTFVANSKFGSREAGSAVMYDTGKIIIVGGGNPPTATAEVIDLNAASPAWTYVGSMASPRRQVNVTLLPDGNVLATGGSCGNAFDNDTCPVHAAEAWNPATRTWTTLASNTVYRGYHSTALLLPDGRVLSAGGEIAGATAEIYSPPYLFKGARPAVGSAPASVGYGSTFFMATPDAASITQVSWLRMQSVTHSFSQSEQRFIKLPFSLAAGGMNITAPSSANLSPPGYYMLFLLNSSGVPSIGQIIRIDVMVGQPPEAPSMLTATAVSNTQINLAWNNNGNNATGIRIERSPNASGFTEIANVAASTSSYQDKGLSTSTAYYYRVRAYNGDGNSDYSNVAGATTLSIDPATLSSTTMSFANTVLGTTSAVKTTTFKNNQSIALNMNGITTSGDFAQTNNCVTPLGPGGSCKISVTFTPTALHARSGTLTVTDDASNSPQVASLNGFGIPPVAVSPNTLTFTGQPVGTASLPKTVSVNNNQSIPLNISSIVASGDFAQTNNCSSPLSAGASCTISITFTPSTIGIRSGNLTLTDDASTSPQVVSLTGNRT